MGRLVLVETSSRLPGLFPFQSWEALTAADRVWARDPDGHPSAPYLAMADIEVVALEPAERLDVTRIDLTQPGSPDDRRYARALVDRCAGDGSATYLLGPADSDASIRILGLAATDEGHEVEFVFHAEPPGGELLRLVEVQRRLRDPDGGCPWDLEQDHRSLAPHLVEEAYELLDAIDRGDDADIAEELGDVLLQVTFHAQMGADRDAFTIDDVARGIADKLVRRHPHVFADVEVADADEVKANWEVLKQEEKQRSGPFEGVPMALPALVLAEKLQKRAAKLGFDWRGPGEPAERVRAEVREVELATEQADREEEIGDLLGAVVGLARHLGVDPEQALRAGAGKFRARFTAVLDLCLERDLDPGELSPDAWRELWEAVKARGVPG